MTNKFLKDLSSKLGYNPADQLEEIANKAKQVLPLQEWVLERFENCIYHAGQTIGKERNGWMEDSEYFRQILIVLEGKERIYPDLSRIEHCRENG